MNNSKEVDSPDTDGSFTHKEVVRTGLDSIPHEVDSHINRLGEAHARPVLGIEGDRSVSHFDHDPDYSWSKDSRSESFSEKSSQEESIQDDEHILYQIRAGFSLHDDLEPSRVIVKVESGLVFISGDVTHEEEIAVIDRIVNEICGVTGLMNTASVRPVHDLHRGFLGKIQDGPSPLKGLH